MRPRLVALASLLAAVVAVVAPAVTNAAPRHNHGLTINATPNPILAGEGVLIYGRLEHRHRPQADSAVSPNRWTTTIHPGWGDQDRLTRVLRVHPC